MQAINLDGLQTLEKSSSLASDKCTPNLKNLAHNSSVIRQRSESQNGGNKKRRHARTFAFRKIWRGLFFCYLRFEIHRFALSPTNYKIFLATAH